MNHNVVVCTGKFTVNSPFNTFVRGVDFKLLSFEENNFFSVVLILLHLSDSGNILVEGYFFNKKHFKVAVVKLYVLFPEFEKAAN